MRMIAVQDSGVKKRQKMEKKAPKVDQLSSEDPFAYFENQ